MVGSSEREVHPGNREAGNIFFKRIVGMAHQAGVTTEHLERDVFRAADKIAEFMIDAGKTSTFDGALIGYYEDKDAHEPAPFWVIALESVEPPTFEDTANIAIGLWNGEINPAQVPVHMERGYLARVKSRLIGGEPSVNIRTVTTSLTLPYKEQEVIERLVHPDAIYLGRLDIMDNPQAPSALLPSPTE